MPHAFLVPRGEQRDGGADRQPDRRAAATSSDAAVGASEREDKQETILSAPLPPQPNVVAPGDLDRSLRFWTIVAATGLCGGLLMRLLRLVQHAAWSYDSGSFLDAVARTSPGHRILVAAVGGLVAAIGLIALRPGKQGNAQEISLAIWCPEVPAAEKIAGAIPILLHAKGPVYVIDHAGRRIGRLDRSGLLNI